MKGATEVIEAAFVGVVAPDAPPFRNAAFSVAGYKCQTSILRATVNQGWRWSCVLGYRPIPAFPQSRRILVKGCRRPLVEGIEADMPGFVNVNPIKQLMWTWSAFWRLMWWALRRSSATRMICVYNLSRPPGISAFLAARLTGSKIVGFLYDVPAPGGPDPDNVAERAIARMTRWLIPRLDGRVVVTDALAEDLAPGAHYLVVDGGIESPTLSADPGEDRRTEPLTFGYAGSLWPINGIDVILNAMELLKGRNIRLFIAGAGMLEKEARAAAACDPRIKYLGVLSSDALRAMYASCDVLLNIRRTSAMPTPYHFPSKLMEYFEAGKPILTTAIGHLERDYAAYSVVIRGDSPEQVAAGFEQVAETDRPVLAEMGRRAREFVRRERTWVRQGERIGVYLRTRVL